MTTAQVVETSVTVNNNSPIQDYAHLGDQTQPTFEMTPGFKPFTMLFEAVGLLLIAILCSIGERVTWILWFKDITLH